MRVVLVFVGVLVVVVVLLLLLILLLILPEDNTGLFTFPLFCFLFSLFSVGIKRREGINAQSGVERTSFDERVLVAAEEMSFTGVGAEKKSTDFSNTEKAFRMLSSEDVSSENEEEDDDEEKEEYEIVLLLLLLLLEEEEDDDDKDERVEYDIEE